MLLEDLGDDLYTDGIAAGGAEAPLYEAAIDALVQLHAERCAGRAWPRASRCSPTTRRRCSAETDLLTEWFLPAGTGRPGRIPRRRARSIGRCGARRSPRMPASAPVFVHRDYHAQNLMWLPSARGLEPRRHDRFPGCAGRARLPTIWSRCWKMRGATWRRELADAMTALYLSRARAGGIASHDAEPSAPPRRFSPRSATPRSSAFSRGLTSAITKPRYLALFAARLGLYGARSRASRTWRR